MSVIALRQTGEPIVSENTGGNWKGELFRRERLLESRKSNGILISAIECQEDGKLTYGIFNTVPANPRMKTDMMSFMRALQKIKIKIRSSFGGQKSTDIEYCKGK